MPITIRAALAAAVLAAYGAAQAQAPAPTTATTPSKSTPTSTTPATSKATTSSTTPAATAPAASMPAVSPDAATGAADKPKADKPKRRSNSNFMEANPDATPRVNGKYNRTQPTGSAAANGANPAKARGDRDTKAGGKGGMQRAFRELQTPEEFSAYQAKAKNVKTVAQCQALIDGTKKELEPRAAAQSKKIEVDSGDICNRAKERGRLEG